MVSTKVATDRKMKRRQTTLVAFANKSRKYESEAPVENVGISDSSLDSEVSHDPEADHSIAHATDGQEAASCHSVDDHPRIIHLNMVGLLIQS